jgi:hypothetical protein
VGRLCFGQQAFGVRSICMGTMCDQVPAQMWCMWFDTECNPFHGTGTVLVFVACSLMHVAIPCGLLSGFGFGGTGDSIRSKELPWSSVLGRQAGLCCPSRDHLQHVSLFSEDIVRVTSAPWPGAWATYSAVIC